MFGDEGDRFYLVLEGTADVYVPVLMTNLDPRQVFLNYNVRLGACSGGDTTRKLSRQQILKTVQKLEQNLENEM